MFGAGGGPGPPTPNLDALAADGGILFRNAYACNGVCVPSRMSLHTGRYPIGHGAANNYPLLHPSEKTMGSYFREKGYATGYFGKTHLGVPDTREAMAGLGWEETFLRGDYNRYLLEEGIEAVYPEKRETIEARTRFWGGGASRIPNSHYLENEIARRASDFISRNREGNFLCFVSNVAPHGPFTPPVPWDSAFAPEEVALCPRHEDELEDKPPAFIRWVRQNRKYLTERELRVMVALTWGLVGMVDENVGRLVGALREAGVYDETLVIFTSDHGDFGSAYGIIGKSWCAVENIIRVPLVMSVPGFRDRARQVEGLVENVDILATMLDWSGIALPGKMHGASLVPVLEGGEKTPKDAVFSYEHSLYSADGMYFSMVREGDWKYVHTVGFKGELYDLGADPREWRNRVDDPACRARVRHLRDRLLDWHVRYTGSFYDIDRAAFWEDETCFWDETRFGGGRIAKRSGAGTW